MPFFYYRKSLAIWHSSIKNQIFECIHITNLNVFYNHFYNILRLQTLVPSPSCRYGTIVPTLQTRRRPASDGDILCGEVPTPATPLVFLYSVEDTTHGAIVTRVDLLQINNKSAIIYLR